MVDFGDGSQTESVTGEQRINHVFPGPGVYAVSAKVTDEQGTTRTWTRRVTIDPAPRATVSRRRGRLVAGIDGGDGRAIAAHWTFADGATADGLSVARRASGGTVTVVDGAGDSATTAF
jgi:hypothetical protein